MPELDQGALRRHRLSRTRRYLNLSQSTSDQIYIIYKKIKIKKDCIHSDLDTLHLLITSQHSSNYRAFQSLFRDTVKLSECIFSDVIPPYFDAEGPSHMMMRTNFLPCCRNLWLSKTQGLCYSLKLWLSVPHTKPKLHSLWTLIRTSGHVLCPVHASSCVHVWPHSWT